MSIQVPLKPWQVGSGDGTQTVPIVPSSTIVPPLPAATHAPDTPQTSIVPFQPPTAVAGDGNANIPYDSTATVTGTTGVANSNMNGGGYDSYGSYGSYGGYGGGYGGMYGGGMYGGYGGMYGGGGFMGEAAQNLYQIQSNMEMNISLVNRVSDIFQSLYQRMGMIASSYSWVPQASLDVVANGPALLWDLSNSCNNKLKETVLKTREQIRYFVAEEKVLREIARDNHIGGNTFRPDSPSATTLLQLKVRQSLDEMHARFLAQKTKSKMNQDYNYNFNSESTPKTQTETPSYKDINQRKPFLHDLLFVVKDVVKTLFFAGTQEYDPMVYSALQFHGEAAEKLHAEALGRFRASVVVFTLYSLWLIFSGIRQGINRQMRKSMANAWTATALPIASAK